MTHHKRAWHHMAKAKRHLARPKTTAYLWRGLAGVFAVAITMLAAVLAQNSIHSTASILGLRLEDHVVGRLQTADFHTQVDTVVYEYEHTPVTIKAGSKTSTTTLAQLGAHINTTALYAQLLAQGRSGNPLTATIAQVQAFVGGTNIKLQSSTLNSKIAAATIATLEKQIHVDAVNASFAFEKGKVVVNGQKTGVTLDAKTSIAALAQLNPVHSAVLELPLQKPGASLTASDLDPLISQVEKIAAKPLTLEAGSGKVTLSPAQLVEIVAPNNVADPKNTSKRATQLSFNESKLNAAIDSLVKQVAFDAKPTIMSGGVVLQQGKAGVAVQDTHVMQDVLAALLERQTGAGEPETVTIPLVAVDPPVVQQPVASSGVVQNRTGTGLVRLTFDDGPGAHTEQVLDILRQYGVHATFYVIGRNVERYPGTMQRIVNEGHTVGNHSYSHSDMTTLSAAGVKQEITSTQAAILAACGVTPTGFRPPGGSVNQMVRNVAGDLGMSVDLWSVDPRDWAQPGTNVITQRVLSADSAGSVILLHVLYQQTVNALPSIIEGIRAQGYTLE